MKKLLFKHEVLLFLVFTEQRRLRQGRFLVAEG
jgi:hypothetical protein